MIDARPYDYVLASYVAGLAVESLLQALALRAHAAHDARHSLEKWLSKCPFALNNALKGSDEWSMLVALWDNKLRYFSYSGLLGYFREAKSIRGKKGGVESKMRGVTEELVDAAQWVHNKEIAEWLSSTKK